MQVVAIAAAAAAVCLLGGSAAHADPCTAIPDHGPAPAFLRAGAAFSGPVVNIIDGDGLCVAVGPRPGLDWVEVRLADFFAPELHKAGGAAAKTALESVALGRQASCVADHQSYDRIVALCTIGGQSIGNLMRAQGMAEGGNASGVAPAQPRVVRGVRGFTSSPTYRSCAEARAAGAAPMYRGQAGFNPKLDGDGDGVACEPYRRR